MIQVLQHINII